MTLLNFTKGRTIIRLIVIIMVAFLAYTIIKPMFFSKSDESSFNQVRGTVAGLQERDDLSIATLAGGCFWCIEAPFQELEGVEEVISGYTGGTVVKPSYQQVIRGKTGHREAVQVYFHSDQVSYQELLDLYWLQIDPTDDGGQFSDRGEQYRTAIYYNSQEQQELAAASKKSLDESGRYDQPIVTEILPLGEFYLAEDYHQNFYQNSATRYKQYSRLSGRKKYIEQIKEKLGK